MAAEISSILCCCGKFGAIWRDLKCLGNFLGLYSIVKKFDSSWPKEVYGDNFDSLVLPGNIKKPLDAKFELFSGWMRNLNSKISVKINFCSK